MPPHTAHPNPPGKRHLKGALAMGKRLCFICAICYVNAKHVSMPSLCSSKSKGQSPARRSTGTIVRWFPTTPRKIRSLPPQIANPKPRIHHEDHEKIQRMRERGNLTSLKPVQALNHCRRTNCEPISFLFLDPFLCLAQSIRRYHPSLRCNPPLKC